MCKKFSTIRLAGMVFILFILLFANVYSENLLPNASFEVGMFNWWLHGTCTLGEKISLVSTGAKYGNRCILLEKPNIDPYGEAYIVSEYVRIEPGRHVTLSTWLKSDRDGQPVILRIWSWDPTTLGKRNQSERTVTVGKSWERYTLTWQTMPANNNLNRVNICLKNPGNVWIDAVQIEVEPDATGFVPKQSIEIGLTPNNLTNLYTEDQKVIPTISVINSTDVVQVLIAKMKITDFSDKLVDTKEINIKISPNKTLDIEEDITPDRFGYFRVKFEFFDSTGSVIDSFYWAFARITNLSAPLEKRFGICMERENMEFELQRAKIMGIGAIRVHNSLLWGNVEPQNGKFDWSDNQFVKFISENGFSPFIHLHGIASWAKSSRHTGVPSDINDWENYVYQCVKQNKEYESDWEIWNEPVGWVPTAEDYFNQLKSAYGGAKSANLNCTVAGLSGFFSENQGFNRKVFELGGLNYMDVVSMHPYIFGQIPEYTLGPSFQETRRLISEFGGNHPIWVTEYGTKAIDIDSWKEPDFEGGILDRDEAGQAQYLVASIVIAFANSVERFYWFFLSSHIYGASFTSTIFAPDSLSSPKKAVPAYAVLIRKLNGLKFCERLNLSNDNIHAYKFADENRQVIVAWSTKDSDVLTLKVAGGKLKLNDIMGNTEGFTFEDGQAVISLTNLPVYIETSASVKVQPVCILTMESIEKIDAEITPMMDLKIKVNNPYKSVILGKIISKMPVGWRIEPGDVSVSLASESTKEYIFRVRVSHKEKEPKVRLRFELIDADEKLLSSAECVSDFKPAPKAKPAHNIWIEAESSKEYSKYWIYQKKADGAYNRQFMHLETTEAPEGPEKYHWLKLPFTVNERGKYMMTIYSTPIHEIWTSPMWWHIDGGDWVHVMNKSHSGERYTPWPKTGGLQKILGDTDLGTVELSEGEHIFEVRVDEVRQINPWYAFWFDALSFRLEGKEKKRGFVLFSREDGKYGVSINWIDTGIKINTDGWDYISVSWDVSTNPDTYVLKINDNVWKFSGSTDGYLSTIDSISIACGWGGMLYIDDISTDALDTSDFHDSFESKVKGDEPSNWDVINGAVRVVDTVANTENKSLEFNGLSGITKSISKDKGTISFYSKTPVLPGGTNEYIKLMGNSED